jgi:prepilin signal peptidase PulO-like enzyme (type II secretory pathway)
MKQMSVTFVIPILVGGIVSFGVNYLADVLPHTRRFSHPVCLYCGHEFKTADYLTLRSCRQCGKSRGIRTWIFLLILIVLSAYEWIYPPVKLGYIIAMLWMAYFAVVFIIDMEHRLILHPTSIAGSFLGLIVGWLNHGLISALLGGLAGFLIMLALYYMGVLFSRFRARRLQAAGQQTDEEEALGAGDVILAGILGLALGSSLIWLGLLIGILLGGVVSVLLVLWLVITRRYGKNALMLFIPYGPYFIISTFLIVYFPKSIAAFLSK